MKNGEKILIIKAGYSEILDKETNSRKVSLGDILRTTPILNLYKKDYVSWVSDESAFPLLDNNPYIDRLLPYDITTILQIESEEFDTVINLEKIPGICALSDKIRAWKKYGFRFNTHSGKSEAHEKAFEALALSSDSKIKRKNKKTVQELLFEMVGKEWNGEEYILGYKPKTKEIYDIGLNTQVGQKWPTKQWSVKNWNILEDMLTKKGISITRQDKQDKSVLENLNCYMEWINSCKMLITNDSLGLHLGIAMKKKVLGLFGATPSNEVQFYGRGKAILPNTIPECMPCLEPTCKKERNCIEYIYPQRIYKEAINFLKY